MVKGSLARDKCVPDCVEGEREDRAGGPESTGDDAQRMIWKQKSYMQLCEPKGEHESLADGKMTEEALGGNSTGFSNWWDVGYEAESTSLDFFG